MTQNNDLDAQMVREMRERLIDRLRRQGWSRIDAENEADDRAARAGKDGQ